jgi:hypothetical protein
MTLFVQTRTYVDKVANYLNELIEQGWKIVNYTIKDDSKTLDVVYVIVEVKKARKTKEN